MARPSDSKNGRLLGIQTERECQIVISTTERDERTELNLASFLRVDPRDRQIAANDTSNSDRSAQRALRWQSVVLSVFSPAING